jgi:hypothetical protein
MVTGGQPQRRAAGGAVAVVLVLAAILSGCGQGPGVPPTGPSPTLTAGSTPQRQGDVFGSNVAGSCVEAYSPATLAKRALAFDGTVTTIGQPSPSGREVADPYVPVTFAVNRWLRGGHGAQVTVAMFPPDTTTTVDNAPYGIGSRLLVSGEDRWGSPSLDSPVAWACGFTRWYTDADAQTWQRAFG